MEQQKAAFISWVKEHKKQLIIAGISATAIIGTILAVRNRKELVKLSESLCDLIKKHNGKCNITSATEEILPSAVDTSHFPEIHVTKNTNTVPFEVSSHIRNLSNGRQASAKKIATAVENGYVLEPGQTWVDSYTKGRI